MRHERWKGEWNTTWKGGKEGDQLLLCGLTFADMILYYVHACIYVCLSIHCVVLKLSGESLTAAK